MDDNCQTIGAQELILIVDDEPRNVRILQKALDTKYNLCIAENGEQALEMVDKHSPAIVLLDIMMPILDGYEVCRKIRENSKYHLTKVILVSGKAMVEPTFRS